MQKYLLAFAFLIGLSACNGQSAISSFNAYSDALVNNNQIWCLSPNGKIRVISTVDGSPIYIGLKNDSNVAAFARDRKGNIVIGGFNNKIQVLDQQNFTRKTVAKFDSILYGLTFDSQNNCYLLTAKGIVDIAKHRTYLSNTSLNQSVRYQAGVMVKPDAYFMDEEDNIWIGFGHGEWGGDLFVFNTRTKKFIKLNECFKVGIEPVKSIFEANGNVYISTGLMHMLVNSSIERVHHLRILPFLIVVPIQKTPTGHVKLKTLNTWAQQHSTNLTNVFTFIRSMVFLRETLTETFQKLRTGRK
jgi:hypothetical protein